MPSDALLVELGAVLVALAVAAAIAARTRLSPIPLYLLVGLALGEGGLHPLITAEDFIAAGAEIGVMLLLLTLGLEYTPAELGTSLRDNLPAAGLDLALNAGVGVAVGWALGWGPVGALALGGVTYASSSGIVAKLLHDLGWLANRETTSVLSLLVAEDLAMAVYLPLLSAAVVGGGVLAVGGSVLLAVSAAAALMVITIALGARIGHVVFGVSQEATLLGLLGATLVVGGFAERVHVSAAVGAFLVGIALSGVLRDRAQVLLHPLRDLFAAIFFLFVGLSIDPADVPAALPVALLLVLLSGLTKAWVGWTAAARSGVGPAGRRRAAALLLPRGEFSLVVAELVAGTRTGDRLLAVAATYVLALAVLSPLVVRLVAVVRR